MLELTPTQAEERKRFFGTLLLANDRVKAEGVRPNVTQFIEQWRSMNIVRMPRAEYMRMWRLKQKMLRRV